MPGRGSRLPGAVKARGSVRALCATPTGPRARFAFAHPFPGKQKPQFSSFQSTKLVVFFFFLFIILLPLPPALCWASWFGRRGVLSRDARGVWSPDCAIRSPVCPWGEWGHCQGLGAVGCWGRASHAPGPHRSVLSLGQGRTKPGLCCGPAGLRVWGGAGGQAALSQQCHCTVTVACGSTVTVLAAMSPWPVAALSCGLWQQCHRICGSNITVGCGSNVTVPVAPL